MSSYDSDSDLEDAEQGTSTDVLLGYATEDATDDSFNQLGGVPSWLDDLQKPSPLLLRCKVCNDYSALLLQLNANLPDRFLGHERRLYIWACKRKACRRTAGSVRATRAVEVLSSTGKNAATSRGAPTRDDKRVEEPRRDIGVSLFGGQNDGGNPFSTTSSSNPFSTGPSINPFAQSNPVNPFSTPGTSNPFSTTNASAPKASDTAPESAVDTLSASFASKASMNITNPPPPPAPKPSRATLSWPEPSQLPKPHKSYHLEADYEFLSETSALPKSSDHYAAFMDVDGASGGGSSEKEDRQLYESEHDRTFQHFADISSQNSEQVLRYEFGGLPLLYSRSDAVGQIFSSGRQDAGSINAKISSMGPAASPQIPKCENCGAPRIFEMQLMPHAIAELETDQDLATLLDEGMEWGTIIVAVCSKDCGSGDGSIAYFEEWAGVQWEETKK